MARRRIASFLVASGFAALSVVMVSSPAAACSCAGGDPRDRLDDADAAFVGTLVERTEPQPDEEGLLSSGQNVVWTFSVEELIKGPLGATVDIASPWSGASCGLEVAVGRRTGLFLYDDGGRWSSSLCSQIQPELLLRAAEPLPAPNGVGPITFIVGGTVGEARLVALDARGRTLLYGFGDGYALHLAACPGGGRIVEVTLNDLGRARRAAVVLRETSTLEVIRQVALPPDVRNPGEVSCAEPDAGRIYVFAGSGNRAELLEIRGSEISDVPLPRARSARVVAGDLYLVVGGAGTARNVVRLDLETRVTERLATVPPFTGPMFPSPDGSHLAAVVYSPPLGRRPAPSQVLLIDLDRREATLRTADLSRSNVTGEIAWPSDDRLVFIPDGDGDEDAIRFYDTDLNELRTVPGWGGNRLVVLGNRAYALQDTTVRVIDLTTGETRDLRRIDGQLFAFTHVPGSNVAAYAEQPDRPRSSGAWPWVAAAAGAAAILLLALAAILRIRRAIR